jgi:hypothetical protein
MRSSKGAKQPDKEAQQEQKLILKDVKDNMVSSSRSQYFSPLLGITLPPYPNISSG